MSPMTTGESAFVNREEETGYIKEVLERAKKGEGKLLLVRGEAGSGKTRLLHESVAEAEKQGFTVGLGTSLAESVTTYHPWKEVLENLELAHILDENPPPKLLGLYLLSPDGRIQVSVEREMEKNDSDIMSSLSRRLSESIPVSKGKRSTEARLTLLSQDGRRMIIKRCPPSFLGAIVEGREDELFLADLDKLADELESIHKEEDVAGTGEELLDASKGSMQRYLESGKYEGIDYAKENPELRQARLFEQIALGLSRKAEIHPICIGIDDLQWADPSSLALLHYIARNTRSKWVSLIGTYRIEEAEARLHLRNAIKRLDKEELLDKMDLKGLSRRDLANLAESFLGSHALSDEFLDLLWKETRGNPLFVREVLCGLEEDGDISVQGISKRLSRPLEELALPDRVREVIATRLERLPKEDRELLDAAATCGSRFTASFVAKVAGEEEERVLNGLRSMTRIHGLLQSRGDGFAFNHPSVKEVVYNDVPTEERQAYHREAAEWLELAGGPIEEIGEHYYRASNPRAGETLREAGDLAFQRYANEEAIRFYDQALEFEEDAQMRMRMLECLGDIHELIGHYDDGIESYRRALELTEKKMKEAKLLAKIGHIQILKGDLDKALRICTEALELVQGSECWGETRALDYMGEAHFHKGDYGKALESYEKALTNYEKTGNHKGIAAILFGIGHVHRLQSAYDEALDYFEKSLKEWEKLGDQRETAGVYNSMGAANHLKGEYDEALEYYEKSLEIREKLGDQAGIAAVLNNIGALLKGRCELDEALRHFGKAVEISRRIGHQMFLRNHLFHIADAHEMRSDYHTALEYYKKSQDIEKRVGRLLPDTVIRIGRIHLNTGAFDRAIEHFEKALALSEKQGMQEGVAASLLHIGRIHHYRGSYDKALEYYEKSLEIEERTGRQHRTAFLEQLMGETCTRRGNYDEAFMHFDKSVSLSKASGYRFDLGGAYVRVAELHFERGNLEEAFDFCNLGSSIAVELGKMVDVSMSRRIFGMIDREHEIWTEAIENFENSIQVCREIGDAFGETLSHYEFGLMWMKKGDVAEAKEHLKKATEMFDLLRLPKKAARAREALAVLDVEA